MLNAADTAPPAVRLPPGLWSVAWVGGTAGIELAWARAAAGTVTRVHDLDTPWAPYDGRLPTAPAPTGPTSTGTATRFARRSRAATARAGAADSDRSVVARAPTIVVLATDAPGRWQLDACIMLARRWPLAVLVAVTTTLGDGRRRSGPLLPGVEEVGWYEFPARLTAWFSDLDAGLPGALGLPATARREERVLQVADGAVRHRARRSAAVAVAAPDGLAVEGLADAVSALGHGVSSRSAGRPPIRDSADIVVWEVATLDQATLAWLRLLTSERPRRHVVVIDSFPRGETALAALRAGAAAVLGRPVGLEPLRGALLHAHNAGDNALGSGEPSR